MRLSSAILAALASLAAAPPATAQDAPTPSPSAEEELAAKLDRYVELARSGAPAVRPQAADRLARMGAPAADRLLAECGATPREMAALGADLVEVLARFDDERLRAKLWQATADAVVPSDLYRFVDGTDPPPTLTVNGKPAELEIHKGYAVLDRRWTAGDRADLALPMPVRRIVADQRVLADQVTHDLPGEYDHGN